VTIPDKIKPLKIGKPDPIHVQTILPKATYKQYQPPSVEDCLKDDQQTKTKLPNAENLMVKETLTPGRNYYTTYSTHQTSTPTHQAHMIPMPYQTKPTTAVIIGGS
jgi:hypothetical protein